MAQKPWLTLILAFVLFFSLCRNDTTSAARRSGQGRQEVHGSLGGGKRVHFLRNGAIENQQKQEDKKMKVTLRSADLGKAGSLRRS